MTTGNPYAAPKANVADDEAGSPVRPRTVGVAFVLLWASVAVALLSKVWALSSLAGQGIGLVAPAVSFAIAFTLLIGVFFWVFRAVAKGRNWGRITVLVIAILATLVLVTYLRSLEDLLTMEVLARYPMWMVATALLFLPESNAWYRAVKASR